MLRRIIWLSLVVGIIWFISPTTDELYSDKNSIIASGLLIYFIGSMVGGSLRKKYPSSKEQKNNSPSTKILSRQDVSSLDVHILVEEVVTNRQIAQEVISLAAKGYIDITYETLPSATLADAGRGGQYVLTRTDLQGSATLAHETALLSALFATDRKVIVEQLASQGTLNEAASQLRGSMIGSLMQRGFIKQANPQIGVLELYSNIGGFLAIVAFVGGPLAYFFVLPTLLWLYPAAALLISAGSLINLRDAHKMFLYTDAGLRVLRQYQTLQASIRKPDLSNERFMMDHYFKSIPYFLLQSEEDCKKYASYGHERYFSSVPTWFKDRTGDYVMNIETLLRHVYFIELKVATSIYESGAQAPGEAPTALGPLSNNPMIKF